MVWSEFGLECRLEMMDEIGPVDMVQEGKRRGRMGWRMGDGSTRRKDAVRRVGWHLWRAWTRVPNRQLMEIQLAVVKGRMEAWEADGGRCVMVFVVADVRIVTGIDSRHGSWGGCRGSGGGGEVGRAFRGELGEQFWVKRSRGLVVSVGEGLGEECFVLDGIRVGCCFGEGV